MQMPSTFGVDAEGLIKLPPEPPLQPGFGALLDELCHSLDQPTLHSLYLYGSAARGEARVGISDLDLTLILRQPPAPGLLDELEQLRLQLQARHPEVSKIDFDIGHLEQVLASDNRPSWGYWLKHHCRCLLGEDLRQRFAPFKPSREIALAVNGDFLAVLNDYATRIDHAPTPGQTLRLQREASRKLLRATNLLRPEQEPSWPRSLDEHAQLFVLHYPQMKVAIEEFRQAAEATTPADAGFSSRLRQMAQWMSQQADTLCPRG
ncbi:nucleotidyltransferase domain-containing protein [Pseudomonas piscis]|uniref:nucleotidyltransferase domain-containing protein n=1 Tax=Pseudomonas piscis TaxID=2614538 RepID=UPI0021D571C9|nr:nucleotidyltransferase domain-containing protein [Pseudomonas piscis]MCU7645972.1 nucleotidyltransferase domain-containing protein [Pseudomonas piscis]